MQKTNEQSSIKVFALGGVGEVGKNLYVVEVDEDIFVLDAGLMYPGNEMYGIDIIIPDVTYLLDNKERVKGIFLTHGHEDHIGALPYLLKKLKVPVYGTKLTLALLEDKLKETGLSQYPLLQVIHSNTTLKFNKITVTFFGTSHSIPDSVGICIHTNQGAIVYTGDFKFDQTPMNGRKAELGKMSAIGDKGVLCLLSDSTNAEYPGYAGSEWDVGQEISKIFYHTKGRIIVAAFATNLGRIQQIFDAAYENNRKVAINGKRMEKVVAIAKQLGYMKIKEDVLIPLDQISNYDDSMITILTTGTQGEPLSMLARMARNQHRQVSIKESDTVLIAATPIPGSELTTFRTIDLLVRIGANVIHGSSVHVTGHGCQEELKLMMNLLKPKFVIPIHGEYRMQIAHQKIANMVGIPKHRVFLIENGDVVEFKQRKAKKSGKVLSGNVLIDGLGVGDVGNIVLRDRRLLSKDGILVVVVTLSKKANVIVSGPEIISRGFVYVRESEELMEEAQKLVKNILDQCMSEKINEWSSLKNNIRETLSQFLHEKTKRRPMILPIIMEV
ncbi:ribonuclease J [Massilibacterium senegalense]|uniref:ribonuclease J n=1 Tax=Massilibacterium senegalense TaxID=1632858 RepID=UPI000785301F|nr:ribonuclease J [Massilibacterium senegalense]